MSQGFNQCQNFDWVAKHYFLKSDLVTGLWKLTKILETKSEKPIGVCETKCALIQIIATWKGKTKLSVSSVENLSRTSSLEFNSNICIIWTLRIMFFGAVL